MRPARHRFRPRVTPVKIARWPAPRLTPSEIPALSGLQDRDLERIADSFKERKYTAGDTIAGEGQGGAGFFVIAEGTPKVTVHGDDRGTLGPATTSARSP